MTASKVFGLIAVILFAVAFVLVAFTKGADAKTVEELLLGGLTSFAAAHCIP